MSQSGGRYDRNDRDDFESGWRGDQDYEPDRRYGRDRDSDYDYGDQRHSARGGWQNRSMESRGGEWNRMGRYGEENPGFGGWENDDIRRTASSRGTYGGSAHQSGYGYGGHQDMGSRNHGDNRSPTYGGSGNWASQGNPYGYGYSRSEGARRNERGFFEKAGDEVSSWFGDEDARRRREMDEHRGRGPKGYARSDERIKEDVSDRLTDDGALDASDIEVQVSNREVTLSGEVGSREDKRRAEDIADLVSGVLHVQNNLRVRNRSAAMMDAARQAGGGALGSSSASGTQNPAGKSKT